MLSKLCSNQRKIWEISAVEFDRERVSSLVPALRFRRAVLSLTCPKTPSLGHTLSPRSLDVSGEVYYRSRVPRSLVLWQSVAEGWGLGTRERLYSSPETSRGLRDRVWPRDVPRSRSPRSPIPRPHSVSLHGRRSVAPCVEFLKKMSTPDPKNLWRSFGLRVSGTSARWSKE